MSTKVNIPDFDFSGFYYGEILDELLAWMRANVPEVSNSSPYEVAVQIMRAFALVGHLNNVLLDITANEGMISTAALRESVVEHLALLGYVPRANIAARGSLRARLTSSLSASTLVVPDNAIFATARKANTPAILFEADEAITVTRTDKIANLVDFRVSGDLGTPAWVNKTADAGSGLPLLALLSGRNNSGIPGGPDDGCAFYISHPQAMTNRLAFAGLTGPAVDLGDNQSGDEGLGYWEYFDGNLEEATPDSVSISGANLVFGIEGFLGDPGSAKVDGWVRVVHAPSGNAGWAQVTWSGTANEVKIPGYLGQASPSLDEGDYLVGAYWREIPNVSDGTAAAPSVTGDTVATGTGGTSYSGVTLTRWPILADSVVSFSWTSGSSPASGTFDTSDGTVTGGVSASTTYDAATGTFALVLTSAADAGTDIDASYSRAPQPFQQDGEIAFVVPMTETEDWNKADLDDTFASVEPVGTPPTTSGFYLRFRVGRIGQNAPARGATNYPVNYESVRWDAGELYLRIEATQGRTFENLILGSGDGTPSQTFQSTKTPVIEGSVRVTVNGVEWSRVESFVSSDPLDEVYIVRVNSDGVVTVTFGDGINGKAAPSGVNNITAELRVGGDDSGNVGANQVTLNRSGLSHINTVTNPRPFNGWTVQEGQGGEAAIEKLKRDGIGSLRTLTRAVTATDYAFLSERWIDEVTGISPFTRAIAIEEGYGPKTMQVVVIPVAGDLPSSPAARARLKAYFDGDATTEGVGMANTATTVEDYVPVDFAITVAISGGDAELVRGGLLAMLQPESLNDDGTGWRWRFGATITTSKLQSLVFRADPNVDGVTISLPASNVVLAANELPRVSLANITVTT